METDGTVSEEQDDQQDDQQDDDGHRDTFDYAYVKRLRERGAGYRHRAKDAEAALDATRRELFRLRVESLGVLADPDDLEYSEELADDPEALADAANALVTRKPHLRSRRVRGNVGQHAQNSAPDGVSLLGLLRDGAN